MRIKRALVEVYLHGNFIKVWSKSFNTDSIKESYEKNNIEDFFKDLNEAFDNKLGILGAEHLINVEHIEREVDVYQTSVFRFYYGEKYG